MSSLNSQLESIRERDILLFISRLIVYHFWKTKKQGNWGENIILFHLNLLVLVVKSKVE